MAATGDRRTVLARAFREHDGTQSDRSLNMRRFVYSVMAIGLLSAHLYPSVAAQRGSGPSPEDALKAYRNDLQGARADIMAKNLTLTSEQAAKFWPAYAKFQAEQTVIVDQQLQAMKKYAENYATLDDAAALAQVDANLSRDLQMNTLRRKWLDEFQKFLPVRTAARVIQIDRRLGLAAQLSISAQLPLIY
jgi:Spy/CpxP family protein refolding chaperone